MTRARVGAGVAELRIFDRQPTHAGDFRALCDSV